MKNKYILIVTALAFVAITAGTIGVIHEVRSNHEIPTQEAVIQDIPEQSGRSYVDEEGSTITEHTPDTTTDGSENEIAIISPEGEIVTIGQEHALSDTADTEQSNNSETVANGQDPSEQKEQSTLKNAVVDAGITQSDTKVSSAPLENQETGNSETNSEVSSEEPQVYETIRIPVK